MKNNSHCLLTTMLMEGKVKFCTPQNMGKKTLQHFPNQLSKTTGVLIIYFVIRDFRVSVDLDYTR